MKKIRLIYRLGQVIKNLIGLVQQCIHNGYLPSSTDATILKEAKEALSDYHSFSKELRKEEESKALNNTTNILKDL